MQDAKVARDMTNTTSIASENLATQIATELAERIQRGDYPKGKRLPSRVQLAKSFQCAPSTVSAALEILSQRRMVLTVPGKGAFLREDTDSPRKALTIAFVGWYAGHTDPELVQKDAFWRGVYTSLMMEAQKKDCCILLIPGTDSEPLALDRILAHEPDVVISYNIRIYPEMVAEFRRAGLPLLCITPLSDTFGASYVAYDTLKTTHKMIDIFKTHGHKRIGYLAHQTRLPERLGKVRQAFWDELIAHGLIFPYGEYWRVIDGARFSFDAAAIRQAAQNEMGQMLDLPEPPTAVYCWHQSMAEGAAAAAAERGLAVGKDLSVIVTATFEDESPFSTFLEPHDLLAESLIETARTAERRPNGNHPVGNPPPVHRPRLRCAHSASGTAHGRKYLMMRRCCCSKEC